MRSFYSEQLKMAGRLKLLALLLLLGVTTAQQSAPTVCRNPLGMESGAIPDASITASSFWSTAHEPYRGRLNGVAGVGAWAARTNTIGQWLQVDLGEMKTVTGTIIQGRSSQDQRVTSYKLQYSEDGVSWTTYASSDGSERVFPGNTDRNTPVTNLLDSPIDARFVRFLPQTYNSWMSMRVEVLGCSSNGVTTAQNSAPTVCRNPLGMESGAIPDASITASSFWSTAHEPYRGRLNGVAGVGAWAARTNTIGEWLQVDLGEMKTVTGTISQGRSSQDQWVTSYKLQYSVDGVSWTTYASSDGSERVFPGNTDRNTPVTNLLDSPIDARFVRFLPQTRHHWFSMRVEVLGCSVQAPSTGNVNLALNRPATQSSTDFNGDPGRAVDGNRNPFYGKKSCSHTAMQRDPWWRVDLGSSERVDRVVVVKRKSIGEMWLEGFQVYVGDNPNVVENPTCGGRQSVAGKDVITVNCGGMTGRYVGIALPDKRQYLILCEVEVYGGPQGKRMLSLDDKLESLREDLEKAVEMDAWEDEDLEEEAFEKKAWQEDALEEETWEEEGLGEAVEIEDLKEEVLEEIEALEDALEMEK
ncbi:lactadherin-like [Branchiostoma floridae x Branchiostoma belcheri]